MSGWENIFSALGTAVAENDDESDLADADVVEEDMAPPLDADGVAAALAAALPPSCKPGRLLHYEVRRRSCQGPVAGPEGSGSSYW